MHWSRKCVGLFFIYLFFLVLPNISSAFRRKNNLIAAGLRIHSRTYTPCPGITPRARVPKGRRCGWPLRVPGREDLLNLSLAQPYVLSTIRGCSSRSPNPGPLQWSRGLSWSWSSLPQYSLGSSTGTAVYCVPERSDRRVIERSLRQLCKDRV